MTSTEHSLTKQLEELAQPVQFLELVPDVVVVTLVGGVVQLRSAIGFEDADDDQERPPLSSMIINLFRVYENSTRLSTSKAISA